MYSFKIRELFIFNTKLKSPKKKPSDDEEQDAKLLYYYPENTEPLVKRSNIGIVEGTLSFLQAFEKVDSNFLLTELNKTFFIADGYEDGFMIGFILDKENIKTFNKYENLDTKKKWFKVLLDNFYDSFVLFHNKFTEFFLNKENPFINNGMPQDKLFMLNDFIMNYFAFIENIKLPIINNLQYFTMNTILESELLLAVLLAVQRLKEKIPNLKMTSIIYKGKLVHNQLPFNVIGILYNIFFSSYECSPKYTKFKNISFKRNSIEINENSSEVKKDNKEKEKKETKQEKNTKKEEKKEEKNEIKEGKNEIKEEKNEIKEENKEKNEIKEEKNEEKKVSPYRKILNIKNVQSQFLTGVLINPMENSYNFFIPKVFIKELDFQEYSMIIYLYKGILFFLFLYNLVIEQQIENISKIQARITKYFGKMFEDIFQLEKPIFDNNIFCYKNENNKSIKFSGFIKKNNNAFDWKLFEQLQKAFFINGDTEMTSITKSKGYYTYFINSIGQEVVLIFKDNLTLAQLKQEVEKIKKIYFGNLFLN